MAYPIVLRSRVYGTQVVSCSSIEEAADTLAHLARYAHQAFENDGPREHLLPSETLILPIHKGVCRMLFTDCQDLRVFAVETDAKDQPQGEGCVQPVQEPLRLLPAPIRAAVLHYEADLGRVDPGYAHFVSATAHKKEAL